ncbi:MAG TPA: hypothetical protein VGX91_04070 [Candidatus Cybelea sp.]|jgi:cyanophycinase-like exopeptidase|nr:hypothetical protein [Candidatus Cybelea sp.]
MLLALIAACAVNVFQRFGAYEPAPRLHGPGLVLDGAGASGSPDATLAWMHRRLLGETPARGGNVVVLRASYTNIDDKHFYRAGNFASVQTILIPPCASRSQVSGVAPIVYRADAVYFAGGDQANYVRWKNSALIAAVKHVYERGGVVGGGSAGLAIQGAVVYDSVSADGIDVETTTADATKNPLERRISFTTNMFAWPALRDTITDTHVAARDRLGRTVAFLARILHDDVLPNVKEVYGLGVDEGSAVVVDPDGMATLLNGPKGRGAWLIRASTPPQLTRGAPLNYTVDAAHLSRNGEHFDLLHKRVPVPWLSLTVDGSRDPVYSRDPYAP